MLLNGWRYGDFTFAADGVAVDPSAVTVRFVYGEFLSVEEQRRDTVQFSFTSDLAAARQGTMSIGYRADAVRGTFNRAGVRFSGAVPSQGPGAGEVRLVETLVNPDGLDIEPGLPVSDTAVLQLFNDGPGRQEDSNSAFTTLNTIRSLRVDKQVTLSARADVTVAVSLVNNLFGFPEPTFLALAAPGMALALRRRRRCVASTHRRGVN